MNLRAPLQAVVTQLLQANAAGSAIVLDEIGNALGALQVSTEEIEAIFAELEAQGRTISGPASGGGEARLKQVIDAARALRAKSSARPSLQQVAAQAGLTRDEVVGALFLLRIMQRR